MAIPLKYNVRSLLVRRVSTAMTGGGIALVVCVFVIVMALVAGLNSAISDTGTSIAGTKWLTSAIVSLRVTSRNGWRLSAVRGRNNSSDT